MSQKIGFAEDVQAGQTQNYPKRFNAAWPLVILFGVLMAGCQKESLKTTQPNAAMPPDTTLSMSASTTALAAARRVQPINLGTAGQFVILSETGISTTGTTSITGNIGVSPIAATAITGFGLIKEANNEYAHTPIVTGKVFASNYAPPTPSRMTTAIGDMRAAFNQANNRVFPAPIVEKFAGNISGRILTPGLYKWGTGVFISGNGVTLRGKADDVWVFQIAQNLTVGNGAMVTLEGGAQAGHIFWVVSGKATLGTTANFKGVILSKTLISLNTGARVTGRLLAQTAVTLIANDVNP